ncbi:MAG TPA: amino acid adenylation domain-containing protein [Bryobacteraceae bacterium]|nr:amino acid adenylation domain-containing protein [Bryobacteraceae bacterium]
MATSIWTGATRLHCTPGPGSASVPSAIMNQALMRPKATAIEAGSRRLTYDELDCQANRLARHLQSLGVGADVLVGLCLPRSLELVIAALGILKAGGACMPMDPAYPAARLAFVLKDSRARVLVTNSDLVRSLPESRCDVVLLDDPNIPGGPDHPPKISILARDLAYVIYATDSDGQPSGVEITHAGLANLISWHRFAFAVTPADRASNVAELGSDTALWELWPYLAAGASVQLADDVARRSPERLRDWMVEKEITISLVPAAVAERLISLTWPHETALRTLLGGGETLRDYPHRDLPFQVVNSYGRTECTVVATSGGILPDACPETLPPIGRAIAGARVYLLDERLEPVVAGTPGEIYLGGVGVARGYRHRPELTAARFVADPFSDQPGSHMFKTGDLAQIRPDGQLILLGRADRQSEIQPARASRCIPAPLVRGRI